MASIAGRHESPTFGEFRASILELIPFADQELSRVLGGPAGLRDVIGASLVVPTAQLGRPAHEILAVDADPGSTNIVNFRFLPDGTLVQQADKQDPKRRATELARLRAMLTRPLQEFTEAEGIYLSVDTR